MKRKLVVASIQYCFIEKRSNLSQKKWWAVYFLFQGATTQCLFNYLRVLLFSGTTALKWKLYQEGRDSVPTVEGLGNVQSVGSSWEGT